MAVIPLDRNIARGNLICGTGSSFLRCLSLFRAISGLLTCFGCCFFPCVLCRLCDCFCGLFCGRITAGCARACCPAAGCQ